MVGGAALRGGEVRWKPEGGRFGDAFGGGQRGPGATLKLVAGEPYLLCLRLSGLGVRGGEGFSVKLRCQPPGLDGGVGCVEEQTLKVEPAVEGRAMAGWVCPLEPCRKEERVLMWLEVGAGGLDMKIPLLAKVYRSHKATRGGNELRAVLCKFGASPTKCASAALSSQQFL